MGKVVSDSVLDAVALSVRMLSADAVGAANSGHPGLPLGLAELGALLFSEVLTYDPKNPKWENRDRLVLSAGHGSMWLYSLLHVSGYAVSLNDIKKFRQFKSKTPGHPEYGHTPGIETTTGPLGAGFANAVGMAISEKMLSKKFSTETKIVDHYTYAVSGDGCMMEGLTSEAASLAGHLGLGKLIVFYDSNHISIEGETQLAFTENVKNRFEAYNWQALSTSAYDYERLRNAIKEAQLETNKPTLIVCTSIIGKGATTLQGTAATHGTPLPQKELDAMKKNLGVDIKTKFFVHPQASKFFAKKQQECAKQRNSWDMLLKKWKKKNPSLASDWDKYYKQQASVSWPTYKVGDSLATRKANGACIAAIADSAEFFTGGSADLQPSNNTNMPTRKSFFAATPEGRILHYGVREHAMGSIVNGITLHGGLRAFGATFLVFSDYMRPSLRLASIMRIPSLFVFTHDSIFVGEDGPTHQPVEHVPSLRLIPHLRVFRPGDAQEAVAAWKLALSKKKDPNALLFTRQNLVVFEKPAGWEKDAVKGAYMVQDDGENPDVVLVATGSEVQLALDASVELRKNGQTVRVVSMFCKELFDEQTEEWRNNIIPRTSPVVIFELAIPMGWDSLVPIGHVGINSFGQCGPAGKLKEYYKLNGKDAAHNVIQMLKKRT